MRENLMTRLCYIEAVCNTMHTLCEDGERNAPFKKIFDDIREEVYTLMDLVSNECAPD